MIFFIKFHLCSSSRVQIQNKLALSQEMALWSTSWKPLPEVITTKVCDATECHQATMSSYNVSLNVIIKTRPTLERR